MTESIASNGPPPDRLIRTKIRDTRRRIAGRIRSSPVVGFLSLHRFAALGVGAGLLTISLGVAVTLFVNPLVFIDGKPEIQEGKERFLADLSGYQAAPIPWDELPILELALPAYEDHSYPWRPWILPPLSPFGTARAIGKNLIGIQQGASTIPSQVAKLYIRRGEPTLFGKFDEMCLGWWMTRQASKRDLLGMYINLSASRFFGGGPSRPHLNPSSMDRSAPKFFWEAPLDPVNGLNRLSLALLGQPLPNISRDEQLLLAGTPKGIHWMQHHPQMGMARVLAARDWLIEQRQWDTSQPWTLDSDPTHLFDFVGHWTEYAATADAPGADIDLIGAMPAFRDGFAAELDQHFADWLTEHQLYIALDVIGPDGAIWARSATEAATMRVPFGSFAKIEILSLAIEFLGIDLVRDLKLSPADWSGGIPWFGPWGGGTRRTASMEHRLYMPQDVSNLYVSVSLDEAVARSHNLAVLRHTINLPYLIWIYRPDLFPQLTAMMTDSERAALNSHRDRAWSSVLLGKLGQDMPAAAIPPELTYSVVETELMRLLARRRAQAGLVVQLEESPVSVLGNGGSASAERLGRYLHGKLFKRGCEYTDLGAALSSHRKVGTLTYLASQFPKLAISGKSGSSPHDDGIVVGVGACMEGEPVVFMAAGRPAIGADGAEPKLPEGLRGSTLLRGVAAYWKALKKLGREPGSPGLPDWAVAPSDPTPSTVSAQPAQPTTEPPDNGNGVPRFFTSPAETALAEEATPQLPR